jgi:hypothetical protein
MNIGRELFIRTIQNQAAVSASSDVVPLAGGAAGTAILAATAGKWARLKSDGSTTNRVIEIDDRVVVLGRSTNVGRGETPTVEYESAYLSELRDGKIVYLRPYESHREALEAAGLRE